MKCVLSILRNVYYNHNSGHSYAKKIRKWSVLTVWLLCNYWCYFLKNFHNYNASISTGNNDPWVNSQNCGGKRRSSSTYTADENPLILSTFTVVFRPWTGFSSPPQRLVSYTPPKPGESFKEASKYKYFQRIVVFCSYRRSIAMQSLRDIGAITTQKSAY